MNTSSGAIKTMPGDKVKYGHSVERSMEYFRMALPLMTKQATPVHPVSYAVWYGYVSAENPALRSAVDRQLRESGPLDEAGTESLYRRYVAEFDPDKAQGVADGFTRVLTGMAESASAAGDQTARYGTSLSRLSEQLGVADPARPALHEVITGTQQTQAMISALQQRLDDSTREISALRDEVRRARRESLIDSLTGLSNRRAFEQKLAAAIALAEVGAGGAPPVLVLADIDHFKRINDGYGHTFGDQVLRAVAKVLESLMPDHAMAARIGGEEFALLLPATSLQTAMTLAENVRTKIGASRIRRGGQADAQARVTISLGIAGWREGDDGNDLLDRADKALYQAKSKGRDCVMLAR
ncbi:MAG: GGDEF domain-containing protein [Burkholderiales bacterium]